MEPLTISNISTWHVLYVLDNKKTSEQNMSKQLAEEGMNIHTVVYSRLFRHNEEVILVIVRRQRFGDSPVIRSFNVH